MRNKVTLIILVLLAAVAAYFYFGKSSGTLPEAYKDFAIEDTASIGRIYIATQKDEQVDLKKVSQGHWLVNDKYKARQDAIDLLLETFNRIGVRSPVPRSAFETVVKQLATSGTKVEIYMEGEEKPEKVYYVGQATENHHGTYMLLEQDGKKSSQPFITYIPGFYGYLSTRFFTEEHLWRDRSMFPFRPDEIAAINVEYAREAEKSFSIERNDGLYTVRNSKGREIKNVDPALIMEYLGRFQKAHFEYVDIDTPPEKRDSILSSQPLHIIEVESTDGTKRKVKTFYKPLDAETYDINTGELLTHNLDRCVGWIDEEDFVTIQYLTLDELMITAQDIENAVAVDK